MFRPFLLALVTTLLLSPFLAGGQTKLYRVGVIHQGGPYDSAVTVLRAGLKDLGLSERKDYILHVRNTKSDLAAVEEAARELESERIDVLVTITTSVTLKAKQATRDVPIVFYAGTDPVRAGLISNYS